MANLASGILAFRTQDQDVAVGGWGSDGTCGWDIHPRENVPTRGSP